MDYYLLTGAGFSANWGGWVASEAFEYLLGSPEILADDRLRDLLWDSQLKGGFEDALSELQVGHSAGFAQQWSEKQLTSLQNAVGRMFEDMNRSFKGRSDLEFLRPERLVQTTEERVQAAGRTVQHFLTRFKALFTLNQDLLLEHLYLSKPEVARTVRPELPGLQRIQDARAQPGDSWADSSWRPAATQEFALRDGSQAYVKLHGSSNWYAEDGRRVLIVGGSKQQTIGTFPILRSYLSTFEKALMAPGSRLMVIGYGFRDNHVNDVLEKAISTGLRLFIVDPNGAELAFKLNRTRMSGQIPAPTSLEAMLKQAVIGGSRRPLSGIFGVDNTEYNKITRFFES
jgi:hypothetical protein